MRGRAGDGETAWVPRDQEDAEAIQSLTRHGWRVVNAMPLSHDNARYRDYILASRGEFTVAKDQNVRLRSGWFSDRSACYLAAGRPVVTQETAFGKFVPTGEGLFAFTSLDDILGALEAINSDYGRHARAGPRDRRGLLQGRDGPGEAGRGGRSGHSATTNPGMMRQP